MSSLSPPPAVVALLRVPLFYKILIANAIIVVLGAVVGNAVTLHYVRSGGASAPLVVAGLALAGVGVTVLVNALILRLALTPLQLLEETAEQVQGGNLDARVPASALADRQLERLTRTFNGMLDSLESYGQRLREVAARALNAEEEERKRISRELHDDTAQTLAALLIRLRLARAAEDGGARDGQLDQFRVELGEALERIRRFARGLRPPALDELGLVPALESHVRMVTESVDAEVRIEAEPLEGVLTSAAELALYRIAQEALSNAIRHSGAKRVLIRLRREPGAVELSVKDDGAGFDVAATRAQGRGLGLFGMEERAFYVGGSVEIESRRGHGTEMQARVPVDRALPRTPR